MKFSERNENKIGFEKLTKIQIICSFNKVQKIFFLRTPFQSYRQILLCRYILVASTHSSQVTSALATDATRPRRRRRGAARLFMVEGKQQNQVLSIVAVWLYIGRHCLRDLLCLSCHLSSGLSHDWAVHICMKQ